MKSKKRPYGTWVLVGLVLLSVGYVVYDLESQKASEKTKLEEGRLIKLDKGQISRFEISVAAAGSSSHQAGSAMKQVVSVDRAKEGWSISSPLSELADQMAVQDYIDGSVSEQSLKVVKEGPQIDWAIYGLDKPIGLLSFQGNSGQVLKIYVSPKKNYEGDSYLRVDGEEKVHLASSTWFTRAEKKPFDFRDKRLLKKSSRQVTSLRVKWAPQAKQKSFEMLKKEDNWKVSSAVLSQLEKWKFDQSKISDFVDLLNSAKITEFSKEGKVGSRDLKLFGLDRSNLTVEASLNNETTFKMKMSPDVGSKKENYVQLFDPPGIFKISDSDMKRFVRARPDEFRDSREPFAIDKSKVKKIRFTSQGLAADFILKDGTWVLDKEDKNLEYQTSRLVSILDSIGNLEVGDFDPDSTEKNLGNPSRKMELLDEQRKLILSIGFFKTYSKMVNKSQKSFLLVKASSHPREVGIDEKTYQSMGMEFLVKQRPKKTGRQ